MAWLERGFEKRDPKMAFLDVEPISAFEWLERACAARDVHLMFLTVAFGSWTPLTFGPGRFR